MIHNRISELNSILESIKVEFFRVNTPKTASNEVASAFHYLPLDNEEINELMSNNFLALESRFAILNKNRIFDSILTIGKFVFLEKHSNKFNEDIDFSNSATKTCLHFLVDASYSSHDFHSCILYGEKLIYEIEKNYNPPFDPNKKDILIALSMAYGNISQYEKSDYYQFLANKKPEPKNIEAEINKPDLNNKLFLCRGAVDNIILGSKIDDIIKMLGTAEKRIDYERMDEMPQNTYLKYYSRGIELLFKEGVLTSIWLKSGRNHGNSEDEKLFEKFKLSIENNISLDSNLEDIESIYGKALKEISLGNDSKIPYKIYRYKSFDINLIIKTGEIATIRLSNDLKI